ncbi:MAG: cytochrome c biogenesis protein CcdA [Acidimicrobiia bacterium]|nr:cytochrome c biogenesis protein CcdA [Acidimicrobiia bacterium]
MAATVNPCGFALLPAYLSAFVGLDHHGGRAGAVGRALAVSAVLTVGFVAVFGAFGLIVTPLALRIEQYLPWVTIVIGVGLVGLGVALLMGRQLVLKLPKLNKGGRDGTLPSMFLFGVSYAVASLSCTIGPFLAVTTSTFRSESWFAGLGVFIAYGLGMGVVIAIVTVAVALAKTGVVQRFRNLLPVMNKVAGGLMLIAGAYVAYYGWYEIRVLNGATGDPIVDRAVELQTRLQNTVVPNDPAAFVIRAVIVLAAVALGAAAIRLRRTHLRHVRRPFLHHTSPRPRLDGRRSETTCRGPRTDCTLTSPDDRPVSANIGHVSRRSPWRIPP